MIEAESYNLSSKMPLLGGSIVRVYPCCRVTETVLSGKRLALAAWDVSAASLVFLFQNSRVINDEMSRVRFKKRIAN